MATATIKKIALSCFETLKAEIGDWGFGTAPASARKYPVLKSLQFASIGALGAVFLTSPLLLLMYFTGSTGTMPMLYVTIGWGLFALGMGVIEFWMCLGVLLFRLKQKNLLDRLSADGLELFASSFHREFEVAANKQTTIDRIIGALQNDKYCRLLQLDNTAGLIRVARVSGMYRLRDFHFQLRESASGNTLVQMSSSAASQRERLNGGIPSRALPEFLELEDNIKSGTNCASVSKNFFRPQKFLLTDVLMIPFAWMFSLCLFVVWSIANPATNSSLSVTKAHEFMVRGDSAAALKQAQNAIDVARKETRRSGAIDLGEAYLNATRISLAPVLEAAIKDGAKSVIADSKLIALLNDGETYSRAAMALDSKWSAPVAELATIAALRGDFKQSDKLITEAEKLNEIDKAELGNSYTNGKVLDNARGIAYHLRGDDVAASLYLGVGTDYDELDVQDTKLRLALLTTLAKDQPRLSSAAHSLKTWYDDTAKTYVDSYKATTEFPFAISLYLFLLVAPPVVLTAMLKDGTRRRHVDGSMDANAKSNEAQTVAHLAAIEESLDEESFWQAFMREAESSKAESTESSGTTIKLKECMGAASESA